MQCVECRLHCVPAVPTRLCCMLLRSRGCAPPPCRWRPWRWRRRRRRRRWRVRGFTVAGVNRARCTDKAVGVGAGRACDSNCGVHADVELLARAHRVVHLVLSPPAPAPPSPAPRGAGRVRCAVHTTSWQWAGARSDNSKQWPANGGGNGGGGQRLWRTDWWAARWWTSHWWTIVLARGHCACHRAGAWARKVLQGRIGLATATGGAP